MKPRLLRSDATAFDNLGFGALTHTISCIVKEELGVAPTLEMSLLNDDPNFVNIEVGNIIAVEPNKNDPIQAFVIEEISKPIDGIVTIYATHIAQHRGKLIPVAPFTATDLDTALSLMVSSSLESNPFTLVRDEGKNNVVATMHPTVPHSFRELMGGVEGSILDTYRGEWKYDNFTCTLYNKRGRDNGVRVMYGRNMSDFKLEEQFNWDNSATGVIGYWVNSEDGTTVIGDIQYSDYADLYPYKKTVCVDFSDKWENQPSVTDLNTYALSWINGKGLYGASVTVAFEHLNVEGGADIGLGDVVHIFNGTYNFEMESRIVGLEYDVLAEEYTSVTIGEQRTTLNEAIADIGGGSTSSGGGGGASVDPSTTLPLMDGTAAVGTEQTYARGDHVHPTDTSRLAVTVAESTYEKKHPVGSVVITSTNTNPSGTYGGTWELVRPLWGGELIAVGIAKTGSSAANAMTSGNTYAFSSGETGATKEYNVWNFFGGLFEGASGTLKCHPHGLVGTIIVDMFLSGECQSGTASESGIWWRNSNSNPLPANVNLMSANAYEPLSMLGKAGDYGSAHNQYIYTLGQGVTGEFFINPQFMCYRNPTWLGRGGTGCKLIAKAYARNVAQYMWKRTA